MKLPTATRLRGGGLKPLTDAALASRFGDATQVSAEALRACIPSWGPILVSDSWRALRPTSDIEGGLLRRDILRIALQPEVEGGPMTARLTNEAARYLLDWTYGARTADDVLAISPKDSPRIVLARQLGLTPPKTNVLSNFFG